MRRALPALLFAAVLACAACGSSRSLSADGATLLEAQVAAARQAAAGGDYQKALSRLASVRDSVFVLRTKKGISDGRAHAVLDAVTAVEAALRQVTTNTTTTTTIPTVTPPAPKPAQNGHGHPGRKHGRGDQGD